MADLLTNKPRPKKCPPIPPDLMRYLLAVYPPVTPKMDWEDRKIWAEVGQRQFLEKLKVIFDQQQKRAAE